MNRSLLPLLAIVLPSLLLAWLAARTLSDQQFLLERQQAQLHQRIADELARQVNQTLLDLQHDFAATAPTLLGDQPEPTDALGDFDARLVQAWPAADTGFALLRDSGALLAPLPNTARPLARDFLRENAPFLTGQETAEIYPNTFAPPQQQELNKLANLSPPPPAEALLSANRQERAKEETETSAGASYDDRDALKREATAAFREDKDAPPAPAAALSAPAPAAATPAPASAPADSKIKSAPDSPSDSQLAAQPLPPPPLRKSSPAIPAPVASSAAPPNLQNSVFPSSSRRVSPARNAEPAPDQAPQQQVSKALPVQTEFARLLADHPEGAAARFLRNRLHILLWTRPPRRPEIVLGASLRPETLLPALRSLLVLPPDLEPEIRLALLDENARPVLLSHPGFSADWTRPFVAAEIGDALPHWEAAVYLRDPASLGRSADLLRLTLGLLVLLLLAAIIAGATLITLDLRRHALDARRKTDFVSNVSHELRTPLTTIRLFTEMLAEGRVPDPEKQRSHLRLISQETQRLSRLIGNILDFARLERGEHRPALRPLDLLPVLRSIAETHAPPLVAQGWQFELDLPDHALPVHADPDAIAQILANLFSNAEKYASSGLYLALRARLLSGRSVEIVVEDRGPGVPSGHEKRIFQRFHRAHDSLASGVTGTGLGLALALHLARAHRGDLRHAPRPGGGARFTLTLPSTPVVES